MGHGRVLTMNDRLFVTTGGPSIIEYNLKGEQIRQYRSGFHDNHLMDLTLDPQNRRLYGLGSCGGQEGGVSVMPVPDVSSAGHGDETIDPIVVFGGRPKPCGERIELLGYDELLVAQSMPVPRPGATGALLILNRSTGEVKRQVPLPSEPVDILPLNNR